jgi:hypothetical protein
MRRCSLGLIGSVLVTAAFAFGAARAQALDGAYRGTVVCSKLQKSKFILRAPLDITISGKTVVAARPVFNLTGARVAGSELITGTVGDDGSLKLGSNWSGGEVTFQGSYAGSIVGQGGTLSGSQAWTGPQGTEQRTCTAAFVQIKP